MRPGSRTPLDPWSWVGARERGTLGQARGRWLQSGGIQWKDHGAGDVTMHRWKSERKGVHLQLLGDLGDQELKAVPAYLADVALRRKG